MKIYLLYLLPKNKLYAITDNKKYLKNFLSERNDNIFKVIIKKYDEEYGLQVLEENKFLKLIKIPLEDSNGDCSITGTIQEDDLLNRICDNMAESCMNLKLHFTKNVSFNNEYKVLLDKLTTITKNINNHPIIQIDSVKLFYYLFKETFIEFEQLEVVNERNSDTDEILEKYKKISIY